MTLDEIREFMRNNVLAVQASVAPDGGPQAAVVGIVVDDEGNLFFDTLSTSRKHRNLRRDPRLAFVIGWDLAQGRTVQLEGVADEPQGPELERLLQLYFARFADGVERRSWPDIAYVRVRPTWLRWSDYSRDPPEIVEHDLGAREPALAMTDAEAVAFARAHIDRWNAHDLDAVMADYTDDVVLTSPVAHALTGSPCVRGKAALRDYFASGLTKYPDLQFDLQQTFRGEEGLTLLFRGAGGRMVAEVLRLDRDRRIARVDAHYACPAPA